MSESSSSESEHSEDEDNSEAQVTDITSNNATKQLDNLCNPQLRSTHDVLFSSRSNPTTDADLPIQDAAVHQQGYHSHSAQQHNEILCPESKKETNLIDVNINSVVALNILCETEWNWFSFVILLEPEFEKKCHSQEVFDQFLVDFASHLPNMGLSVHQLNLVEQSHAAYLSEVLEKEKRIQEIIEEVSSSDDDSDDECDCNEELSEKEILTKLKLIKDKAKRKAKAEIEFKGLDGKRKSVKTTKSVLSRHPDIGEVMENIVKDADVGADKSC